MWRKGSNKGIVRKYNITLGIGSPTLESILLLNNGFENTRLA